MVVRLIPVCECGHIFKDGIHCLYEEYTDGPVTLREHTFDPPICPVCREKIEAITAYRSPPRSILHEKRKRYAEVGDYVKIVSSKSPTNRFSVGRIYKVARLLSEEGWNIPGCVILDCGEPYAKPSEYIIVSEYEYQIQKEKELSRKSTL